MANKSSQVAPGVRADFSEAGVMAPPIETPSLTGPTSSSLVDHLGALVDKRLRKLTDSRKFAFASDPIEALHDLRVASRRLRGFVDAFEPLLDPVTTRRARKLLRRVTRAAGALRDLDVQGGLLEGYLVRAATDLERAALEHLLEEVRGRRVPAEKDAQRRMEKVRFDKLESWVLAALEDATEDLALDTALERAVWTLLEPYIARAEEELPPDDGAEHPEPMHRLRVRVKKLRYALELFEPVLGSGYAALVERAVALQELLGHHHDVFVLGELLAARRKELESRGRHALVLGLAHVERELAAERVRAFEQYRTAAFDPSWWRSKIRAALDAAADSPGRHQGPARQGP